MDPRALAEFLRAFDQSPRAAQAQRPPKRAVGAASFTPPLASVREGGRFVTARDGVRSAQFKVVDGVVVSLAEVLPGRAPIEGDDRPRDLVDELRYEKLAELDAAGLMKAHLPETPWSSDYWGIYRGILGCRYADENYPRGSDWKEYREYVQAHPLADIVASNDAERIDALSPSEKYDLLVGDARASLTEWCWRQGQEIYDRSGSVETWMGICHGWAPGAYMVPRPYNAITVLAADGNTQVTFYPDDLKGLASLLWANARTVSNFIGGRCNEKSPKTDEVGRFESQDAFDTNPGTWHLAITNQIGVAKRSFVLDATYDYEVWNQPVEGYEYRYFNPQTLTPAATLAEATVKMSDFTADKFKRHRSPKAASIVGIEMTVRYMVETRPTQTRRDSSARDASYDTDYRYDLELDAEGKIIGGEWYVNAHPDFLWTPPPGTRAISLGDALATGDWRIGDVMPEAWRSAAVRASGYGMPLAKVVERLVKVARV